MIAKTHCKECNGVITRQIPERQSLNKYYFGKITMDMRGINTRKYCLRCRHERKKLESRLYQQKKRESKNPNRKKRITQRTRIKERLVYYITKYITKTRIIDSMPFEYNDGVQSIYNNVVNDLNVPRTSVRRVMNECRKDHVFSDLYLKSFYY